MKTLNSLCMLALVGLLLSCDSTEKRQLLSKVDSLEIELRNNIENAQTLQEIGTLIDSIDASREVIRTNVVEGTTYTDYQSRLRDINKHILDTRDKIAKLEKSLKKSSVNYAATIKRLKADLEASNKQLAVLQEEVEKIRQHNQELVAGVTERDKKIAEQQEVIKMREKDVAALETHLTDVRQSSEASKAELYFAQAQALEIAAERTKFAPKKKKETQREALELYKLSRSLGYKDAEGRIQQLEKELG